MKLFLAALLAANATGVQAAVPVPKFAVAGMYAGMTKAEAKRVGLHACAFGDGLLAASDAVLCRPKLVGQHLAGLPVDDVKVVFRPPRNEWVQSVRFTLPADLASVRAAFSRAFGAPQVDEDFDYWYDRGAVLRVYKGRRGPIKAELSHEPAREAALKRDAAAAASRKEVLRSF